MHIEILNLLQDNDLIDVVDIGANPIDGTPPYMPLYNNKLCRITGFEPQKSAFDELNKLRKENQNFLPYALGDGEKHQLHICSASGMTSLLKPDLSSLEIFFDLAKHAEIIQSVEIETLKLDDVSELENIDYLKIDIQGAELLVLKHGTLKLSNLLCIQIEVSFITLYENQPTFGEVDSFLRSLGLIPLCFAELKHWPANPFFYPNNHRRPINQLLEADIVYIKDHRNLNSLSDRDLKKLSLISHFSYGAADLTMRFINELEIRKVVPEGTAMFYKSTLNLS